MAEETDQTAGEPEPRTLVGRLTAFETALVAGGIVLFLVLLYEMRTFLNPFILGGVGVLVLWPVRTYRPVRALLMAGGALLLLWFLAELSVVLVPFAVVYLLAFLFDPLVDRLQARWGVRRWISALVVSVAVVGLVALVVGLLVPSIIAQLEVLGGRALEIIAGVRDWIATSPLLADLEAAGLINRENLLGILNRTLEGQTGMLAGALPEAAQGLIRSLGSLLGALTLVAVLPVTLYYTLKDYHPIRDRLIELFPTRDGRRDYLLYAGAVMSDYLRGRLIIGAIAAFNVSVLLLILGVPFALLIGLMAGLLNLIPNLGAVITTVVAVVIAFLFGDPWLVDVIVVLAVLLGQALLEQSFLTPKILSYQVGLHPVLILLSLFVFGYLMGLFGLLIAVPATALLVTAYKAYRHELTLELSSAPGTDLPNEQDTPVGNEGTGEWKHGRKGERGKGGMEKKR